MASSHLFLKTFDPMLMNGFKNKKELENYWFFSQLGCICIVLGLLCELLDILFFSHPLINIYSLMYIILGFMVIFLGVFSLPFLVNWLFIRHIPDNLPHMYVKYIWLNSKNAILVLISDLPEELISLDEKKILISEQDDNVKIEILIQTWHKVFNSTLTNNYIKVQNGK